MLAAGGENKQNNLDTFCFVRKTDLLRSVDDLWLARFRNVSSAINSSARHMCKVEIQETQHRMPLQNKTQTAQSETTKNIRFQAATNLNDLCETGQCLDGAR